VRYLFIVFVLTAAGAQSLRHYFGAYSLVEHLRGELRLGYIDSLESALGAAGHFHLRTGRKMGWCLAATLEGVARLDGEHPEFFPKSGSFATLSELFVSYKKSAGELKAGRMMVEYTPHLDSDDIRLFPNYFRGIYGEWDLEPGQLQLFWFDRMAGWESGEPMESFKNLGRVLGLDEDIAGLFGAGITAPGMQLWFYHIDSVAEILYMERTWVGASWSAGVQGDFAAGEWPLSRTLGATVRWEPGPFALFGAANRLFGDKAAPSFGGGPLFTSLELLSLDLFGADAAAFSLGGEFEVRRNCVGVVYGKFYGESDDEEVDIYFQRRLGYGFRYDVVYGTTRKNGEILRAIVRYGF